MTATMVSPSRISSTKGLSSVICCLPHTVGQTHVLEEYTTGPTRGAAATLGAPDTEYHVHVSAPTRRRTTHREQECALWLRPRRPGTSPPLVIATPPCDAGFSLARHGCTASSRRRPARRAEPCGLSAKEQFEANAARRALRPMTGKRPDAP